VAAGFFSWQPGRKTVLRSPKPAACSTRPARQLGRAKRTVAEPPGRPSAHPGRLGGLARLGEYQSRQFECWGQLTVQAHPRAFACWQLYRASAVDAPYLGDFAGVAAYVAQPWTPAGRARFSSQAVSLTALTALLGTQGKAVVALVLPNPRCRSQPALRVRLLSSAH
jgi:hypothetical protein